MAKMMQALLQKFLVYGEVLQLHAFSEGSLYKNADVSDLACDDCQGNNWM